MIKTTSKVFLGGTCNESTWRAKLKPTLKTCFCCEKEMTENGICDHCLVDIDAQGPEILEGVVRGVSLWDF